MDVVRVKTDTYQLPQYTRTYQGRVTDKDPNDAYRLVGFFEYGKALENFDKLLRAVDADELAAIDQILKNSKEFTIYTNLSRRLEKTPSPLSERQRIGSRKKLGFAWVVALARLEFGAMLAGFTDTQRPFEVVAPSRFELASYKTMLLDGLRTHVWALLNDAELQSVMNNKSRNDRLLAYFRRAGLARKFGEAARRLLANDLKPQQRSELETWMQQISSLENTLRRRIGQRLDALTGSESLGGNPVKTGSTTRTRVQVRRGR